jgi:hypothetical protein
MHKLAELLKRDHPDGAATRPRVDALLSAAHLALQHAMAASPVVTKPSDVKALADSAANAR